MRMDQGVMQVFLLMRKITQVTMSFVDIPKRKIVAQSPNPIAPGSFPFHTPFDFPLHHKPILPTSNPSAALAVPFFWELQHCRKIYKPWAQWYPIHQHSYVPFIANYIFNVTPALHIYWKALPDYNKPPQGSSFFIMLVNISCLNWIYYNRRTISFANGPTKLLEPTITPNGASLALSSNSGARQFHHGQPPWIHHAHTMHGVKLFHHNAPPPLGLMAGVLSLLVETCMSKSMFFEVFFVKIIRKWR